MRSSVEVFMSARGKLSRVEKLQLDMDESATVEDLDRVIRERCRKLERISESMKMIRTGKVLTENSEELRPHAEKVVHAVFVESPGRTHVDKLEPFMGLTTGGAKVQIIGENFGNTVRMVKFGTTEVEAVRYSSTLLVCVAPPHAPGIVGVEVESPGEGFTSDGQTYTYVDSVAEASEVALAVCNDRSALAPMPIESCRTINPFTTKRG
mmetsp:Transcript_10154/g.31066  ORF Transcript_10154/g.31066 Transcript_10154/m.31066 type:complete len:209 (+) Transcript_10154:184-810(+)